MNYDKENALKLLSCLCQKPSLLSQKDKYDIKPKHFNPEDRDIFYCIAFFYNRGHLQIDPIEICDWFEKKDKKISYYLACWLKFGPETEEDNIDEEDSELEEKSLYSDMLGADLDNFDDYYNTHYSYLVIDELNNLNLKKLGVKVEKNGLVNIKEINPKEILTNYKRELVKIETGLLQTSDIKTTILSENIDSIIDALKIEPDVGLPFEDNIINLITRGARPGMFYIRSAATNVGKTRGALSDCCYLSFPMRIENGVWVNKGNNSKTLFIATEQQFEEIITMIVAYLTNINEEKLLYYNRITEQEELFIEQAKEVIKYFNNITFVQVPNPTIETLKAVIREQCLINHIDNVFFDYIHTSPAMFAEFKGAGLRSDELLGLLSNALKDLAVELNVFMMSSTQLNSEGDAGKHKLKGVESVRGSRAIIDKADIAFILSRISEEEKNIISQIDETINTVQDIYKVRRGQWNQLKVWSSFEYGTLRKAGKIITDTNLNPIPFTPYEYIPAPLSDQDQNFLERLNYANNIRTNQAI